jgi:hypothetical protein
LQNDWNGLWLFNKMKDSEYLEWIEANLISIHCKSPGKYTIVFLLPSGIKSNATGICLKNCIDNALNQLKI